MGSGKQTRFIRVEAARQLAHPDAVLGDRMVPPSDERIEAFKERLRQRGWIATVRRRRGDDVSAACGQLRAFGRDPRGVRARAKAPA